MFCSPSPPLSLSSFLPYVTMLTFDVQALVAENPPRYEKRTILVDSNLKCIVIRYTETDRWRHVLVHVTAFSKVPGDKKGTFIGVIVGCARADKLNLYELDEPSATNLLMEWAQQSRDSDGEPKRWRPEVGVCSFLCTSPSHNQILSTAIASIVVKPHTTTELTPRDELLVGQGEKETLPGANATATTAVPMEASEAPPLATDSKRQSLNSESPCGDGPQKAPARAPVKYAYETPLALCPRLPWESEDDARLRLKYPYLKSMSIVTPQGQAMQEERLAMLKAFVKERAMGMPTEPDDKELALSLGKVEGKSTFAAEYNKPVEWPEAPSDILRLREHRRANEEDGDMQEGDVREWLAAGEMSESEACVTTASSS